MDILHILRSAPDSETEKMISELSDDQRTGVIKLYEAGIDWDGVIDALFSHDRVVCWW
jgi:hypothetical protein